MKTVEILEVFVMYVHVLNMEACLYEILNSPPSCFIIVKEGTDMGEVSFIQIVDSPCHVAHGVHHKGSWLGNRLLSLKGRRGSP